MFYEPSSRQPGTRRAPQTGTRRVAFWGTKVRLGSQFLSIACATILTAAGRLSPQTLGSPAPDFTLKTLAGDTASQSDYTGRRVSQLLGLVVQAVSRRDVRHHRRVRRAQGSAPAGTGD